MSISTITEQLGPRDPHHFPHNLQPQIVERGQLLQVRLHAPRGCPGSQALAGGIQAINEAMMGRLGRKRWLS